MTAARAPAAGTALFGVVVFSLFVVFAMLPEVRAAGQCLAQGAVVEFELAANAADLQAIFGPADGACRTPVAMAMDAVNRLDLLAFIPAYTLLCIAGALMVARGGARLLVMAAIAAALGAAAADIVETTTLLQITQRLDDPDGLPAQASTAAWTKFALLAAHAFFSAGMCWNDARRRPLLGLLLLAPALGTAAAWVDADRFLPLMNLCFAVAWIALLAAAIVELASRPRASAAPAPDGQP